MSASFITALKCLDFVEFDSLPEGALECAKGEDFITYRGINQRDEPHFVGWDFIIGLQPKFPNMSALSIACFNDDNLNRAVSIYYENIFMTLNLNAVTSQTKINRIFTMSALLGVVTTARLAQVCVGCTPDGVLGLNSSIPAINRSMSFNNDFDYICTMFLKAKCLNVPSLSDNLKGWLNRISKVANYAK